MPERRYGRPDKWMNRDDEDQYIIHPDNLDFYLNYYKGKDFGEIVAGRKAVIEHGFCPHNADHDQKMLDEAKERLDKHTQKGNIWPPKNGKKVF